MAAERFGSAIIAWSFLISNTETDALGALAGVDRLEEQLDVGATLVEFAYTRV